MAKVAVVGSRHGIPERYVRKYVQGLRPGTIVISGGAIGVDQVVASEARLCGFEVIEIVPDYDRDGPKAPLKRNIEIASMCDRMTAFWNGSCRSGAMHAVRQARGMGKRVSVYDREGRMTGV